MFKLLIVTCHSIQPGKKRKGYIGHLVTIAKSLHNTEAFYSEHFRRIIVNTLDSEIVNRWDSFTSTTLEDNEGRISSCLVVKFNYFINTISIVVKVLLLLFITMCIYREDCTLEMKWQ